MERYMSPKTIYLRRPDITRKMSDIPLMRPDKSLIRLYKPALRHDAHWMTCDALSMKPDIPPLRPP